MGYEWQFAPVLRAWALLAQGGIGTLKLTGAALLLGLPLGLGLAVVRIARVPMLARAALLYTEFFRLSAAIVLLYWCYFALPVLLGVTFDAFTAALLAIGLQAAAFYGEVFRSGLQSVPRGQWDAARAIGMRGPKALRWIILPQAIRATVPVFLVRLVDLLKTTSLAAVIAYPDIVYAASRIASDTYRPIETYTVLGGIFFVVIFSLSRAARALERRLAPAR